MAGVVNIRAALETALNAMSPALATAWENVAFAPVAGTPYQRINLLLASPENIEFSRTHREIGYMQVKLMYPLQTGTAAVSARVELIRSTFYRGACIVASGSHLGGIFNYLIDDMGLVDSWGVVDETIVIIDKTPEVSPGSVEGDRYAVPVKIRFYATIL